MNLTLETQRLLLTPLTQDDIDISIEMFTDPEVTRYAGGVVSREDIDKEISSWVRRGSRGGIGIWCAKEKDSGEKLGTGALLPQPVDDDDTDFSLVVMDELPDADIEVGYFLKRSVWGRGYATEICSAMLRVAFDFEVLDKVVATIDEGNSASEHVLVKSGFRRLGHKRAYGEMEPYFAITRSEWLRAV